MMPSDNLFYNVTVRREATVIKTVRPMNLTHTTLLYLLKNTHLIIYKHLFEIDVF